MATKYDEIACAGYSSLRGKLKPLTCQSCKDDGLQIGECPTCLQNRAWNRNYIETHLFITDSTLRRYHNGEHANIKTCPIRLPDEHPYLYYGVEIEVGFDTGAFYVANSPDSCDDYEDDYDYTDTDTDIVLSEFSKLTQGLFVYEEDSTLSNGVELISRPGSYAFWTHPDTVEILRKGFEYLKSKGALVQQPDNHGMHIHASRKFFERPDFMRERSSEVLKDFDWLYQRFQPELEKICGREWTEWCEGKKKKVEKYLRDALRDIPAAKVEAKCKLTREGQHLTIDDHHSAVNLTSQTIETRIFKSTIDHERILANIELVRAFAHTVREGAGRQTLDAILHTKETQFLDKQLQKRKMECRRDKQELDLTKVNDDEVEFVVERN